MYIISEESVLKANQRMMECKVERETVDPVSHCICVSVIANGRVYKQEVTEKEMRKAFKKALKSSNAMVSLNDVSMTIGRIKKSRFQFILRKRGQLLIPKDIKHTLHASRI